jgi:ribosomal protein L37AE/L43A
MIADERGGCPGCSSQSKEYAREGWTGKHYLRALKWAWEYRRRLKVGEKRCPFCDVGFFQRVSTLGVFKCSACGSHALDGRPTTARKIT